MQQGCTPTWGRNAELASHPGFADCKGAAQETPYTPASVVLPEAGRSLLSKAWLCLGWKNTVPVEGVKDPTSEQCGWHSLARLSLVTNPSWPHSKGGRAVQGSGRCVPKQTPLLCKYLQQQESQSDHRGGEACQCETWGTCAMGTWEGSVASKGAGGQPWWIALCRCQDLDCPALSNIQREPEIQINMWNLGLWNVGDQFVLLFNNLRMKQNTSGGGSCGQDAQFCDPSLSLSSKASWELPRPLYFPWIRCRPIKWVTVYAGPLGPGLIIGTGSFGRVQRLCSERVISGACFWEEPQDTPTELPDIGHNVPPPLWGARFAGGFVSMRPISTCCFPVEGGRITPWL